MKYELFGWKKLAPSGLDKSYYSLINKRKKSTLDNKIYCFNF